MPHRALHATLHATPCIANASYIACHTLHATPCIAIACYIVSDPRTGHRLLLQDGPDLLLAWIGKYDPETRAAVKAATHLVGVSFVVASSSLLLSCRLFCCLVVTRSFSLSLSLSQTQISSHFVSCGQQCYIYIDINVWGEAGHATTRRVTWCCVLPAPASTAASRVHARGCVVAAPVTVPRCRGCRVVDVTDVSVDGGCSALCGNSRNRRVWQSPHSPPSSLAS